MNGTKLIAAALAALAIGGASANAACKPSHVANKTWIMSATDTSGITKVIFYCRLVTSAAGTVTPAPDACVAYDGTAPTFTATSFDLLSGALIMIPGPCAFDLDLALVAPGKQTVKARLIMEAGKTTATGGWISNFGSFGTVSIMRQ